MNRRDFIKLGAAAGAGAALTSRLNFVQNGSWQSLLLPD
ncbi:MAG: twin-arginine translocation signal domain-containing protein [Anaerolineales bacterium]|nr:twin-arginine translocation signal domain-containing protein [Anaerolineales bacterium]